MSEPTEQQLIELLRDANCIECWMPKGPRRRILSIEARKAIVALLSDAAPRQAEGDEPFREAYVEISQIVGRQGSESHSLADDVRRLKAAGERRRAALETVYSEIALGDRLTKIVEAALGDGETPDQETK